jgi:tetratricopeptide (TPR) repeat protein
VIIGVLVGSTFLTFAPVFQNDFVSYDDRAYVTENPRVQSGLTWHGLYWGLTTLHYGAAATWHPIVWWSLMLDAQLYGPATPSGFHLTNLLWHLASCVLLFAALRRMTGWLWPSALTAALFAAHPLNVEPVAWVAERKGILSTFFWMLSLWCYVRYAEQPSLVRYLCVLLAMILGLLAKPMLVTLPFVFLLLDYWPLGRLRLGRAPSTEAGSPGVSLLRLTLEKLPLLGLSAAFSVIAVVSQTKGGALASLASTPLSARWELAAISYVTYIKRAICPLGLAAYYPFAISDLSLATAAEAAILLLALTGLCLWYARRAPYLIVGWLWYIGTLVPVIGLVQLGSSAQADRYAYVPLVGVFMATTWSMAALAKHWGAERWAIRAAVLVVGVLMLLSSRQVRVWEDSDALWTHALAVTSHNYVAHNNLAIEFKKRGELDEALNHFDEALRIAPGHPFALVGRGQCLLALGRFPEAVSCFRAAIQSEPGLSLPHQNLGAALARSGATAAAAEEFRTALQLDRDNTDALLGLARALHRQGQAKEAIPDFLAVMELRGSDATLLSELGTAYQMSGDWQRALATFRRLVELRPDSATDQSELAFCLSRLGLAEQATEAYHKSSALDAIWPSKQLARAWRMATDGETGNRWGERAALLAEKVIEVTGQTDARALDVLGAAYAEAGRFGQARETATRARALARAAGQGALVQDIETRLRLYEKSQAFHLAPGAPDLTVPPGKDMATSNGTSGM